MSTLAIWTVSALGLQLMFGAYVAGLDAGYAFNSWPKMGEDWFPAGTPMLEPFIVNFADNPIVVQFVHRWLAFIVAGLAVALALKAWKQRIHAPAAAIVATTALQILLGIATLLTGVELWIAVAHQAMAALLLGALLVTAHSLGANRKALGA
jgi:cytochrome c oxidase assembly protein subunit 15